MVLSSQQWEATSVGQRSQSCARVSHCCLCLCSGNGKTRSLRICMLEFPLFLTHLPGIKGTRMCIQANLQNSAHSSSSERAPFHLQVASEANDARDIFTRHGIIWPLGFTGFNTFGCADVRFVADEVNAAFSTSEVVELMCHVGLRGHLGTGFGPDDVWVAFLYISRILSCSTFLLSQCF